MLFPPSVLGRAMQIKEVILRTINGEYTWNQAAEILGITSRGLKTPTAADGPVRLPGVGRPTLGSTVATADSGGGDRADPGAVSGALSGFNARHFCSTVRREHGVKLSYTCMKQILQGAGLVEKRRIEVDTGCGARGSPASVRCCTWTGVPMPAGAGARGEQTLIQVVDDATSRLLYAQRWPSETTRAVMTAMSGLVREHGIPELYYTDRARWAFETPKAGGKVSKTDLTQVGEALDRLGVEHIPSYSPQGRGRSERMNRTLQDRLVNELQGGRDHQGRVCQFLPTRALHADAHRGVRERGRRPRECLRGVG